MLSEQNIRFYPRICVLGEQKFHLILEIRVLSETIPHIGDNVKPSALGLSAVFAGICVEGLTKQSFFGTIKVLVFGSYAFALRGLRL